MNQKTEVSGACPQVTLDDLRRMVRIECDGIQRTEAGEEVVDPMWTDDYVDYFLNQSYNHYWLVVAQAGEGYFEELLSISTQVGQGEYQLPDIAFKLVEVKLLYGSTYLPIPYDRSPFHARPKGSGAWLLPTFRIEGTKLVLDPAPLDGIIGGLSVRIIKLPKRLCGRSRTTLDQGFLSTWIGVVVLFASIGALSRDKQDTSGHAERLIRLERTFLNSIAHRATEPTYSTFWIPGGG